MLTQTDTILRVTMSMQVRRCKRCKKLHKPEPENLDDEDIFCDVCTFVIDSDSPSDSSCDEADSDEESVNLSNLWRKKPFLEISESESSDEESSKEEEEDRSHEVDALWNFSERYYSEDGVTLILSSSDLLTEEDEDSAASESGTYIPKEEFNFRGQSYDRQGLFEALRRILG